MTLPVRWLIEKDVFLDGNPERMAEIIGRQGMDCRVVRYSGGQPVRAYADGDRVIVYGSMGFVRDMVHARRWRPTAWFDEQVLACHHYYGQPETQHDRIRRRWRSNLTLTPRI